MDFLELIRAKAAPAAKPEPAETAVSPWTGCVPETLDAIGAEDRAEARERRRFLALVDRAVGGSDGKMDARAACALVAARHADEFPVLTHAGRGGASSLTYHSYRNWRQILLDYRKSGGTPTEEDEVRLLVKRYAKGERGSMADKDFLTLFQKFYLSCNCFSLPRAYRLACDAWRKIAPGRVPATLGQARLQIKRLAPEVIVRGREGEIAWRNKCCDYITRDWGDVLPGALAIGDSRTFDTRVRVRDERNNRWIPVRPTIAALLDARSWRFVAYWITTDPVNSDTLINTLALWCHNTGGVPPAACYFDNGKDYNARGFSTPVEADGHEHSIFSELGIRLVNATAYNGRAKTIERAFRDMMAGFDKLFSDYLGSNPARRSDASTYYDAHPESLPSLGAFCKVFSAWLDQYHATPKNGRIHDGKSPDEIWALHHKTDLSRRRTPEALAEALLRPEGIRQIGRGGAVRCQGEDYITDDVRWGEKVLIKRSAFDPTFVMLYAADGRKLGIARTREAIRALAGGTDDAERLKALIARQARQDRAARTMLHDLTGGAYGASPLEILLTAGTDAAFRQTGRMRLVKGGTHNFRLIEAGGTAWLEDKAADNADAAEAAGAIGAVCARKKTLRDDVTDAELEAAQNILKQRKTRADIDGMDGADEIKIISKPNQGENEDEW